jgi:hypothetical protein
MIVIGKILDPTGLNCMTIWERPGHKDPSVPQWHSIGEFSVFLFISIRALIVT